MADKSLIRVGVNGARGKMGQVTVSALSACSEMICAFETDKDDDLASAIKDSGAAVVVDFTAPDAVFGNAMTIIESHARPVVGTTGLEPHELDALDMALRSRDLGGIVAPNFCLGALLMMKLSATAARYMKHCEIIESHHEKKVDSPSGTALMTAASITGPLQENRPAPTTPSCVDSPSRGLKKGPVTIHSIRLPGHLAHQQVVFGGQGESLTISHNVVSRESFIPGILLAIREVGGIQGLQQGIDI